MVVRPRNLASGQGQRAQVGAINDRADQLLLDHDVATRWDDTVAKQTIQDVFTENDNLLVTVLNSKKQQRVRDISEKKSSMNEHTSSNETKRKGFLVISLPAWVRRKDRPLHELPHFRRIEIRNLWSGQNARTPRVVGAGDKDEIAERGHGGELGNQLGQRCEPVAVLARLEAIVQERLRFEAATENKRQGQCRVGISFKDSPECCECLECSSPQCPTISLLCQ